MEKEFWTYTEIMQIFKVEESFLLELMAEDIICPTCREGNALQMFSAREMEKLRLAKILVEEMEVNLPGVEVILRMRQNMIDMRRQFDDILEEVSRQLKKIKL